MGTKDNFDVIIIGGSYSGLSAAMALGRALRRVLVIDSRKPCNRQTPYSHNFITQDGEKPSDIAQKAKAQVLKYSTVTFLDDIAIDGSKINGGFIVKTALGRSINCKKLIFATGVMDKMPNIKGFSACWGISILHCPYCHGYEVKGEKTGILADGNAAMHYAMLIRNWTKDITIFTNGKSTLMPIQTDILRQHHIGIVEKKIVTLEHNSGHIKRIVFMDNSTFALNVVYARPEFEQHCRIAEHLGCELTEMGHIKVDMFQKTTVDHIYASGDCASMMRSVANAVGTGSVAGAMVNNIMSETEFTS